MLASVTVPTAIVTSAPGRMVDAFDEALLFRRYIDVVIHGDHVNPRYKPDPLGLQMACDKLGVDPSMCVYIGDQACDIEAATAIGMPSILLRGMYTPASVSHQITIDHPREFAEALTRVRRS